MPYQNSVISAGQLAMMAIVAVAGLAVWLTAVFIAARNPLRGHGANAAPLSPRQPTAAETEHKSAA